MPGISRVARSCSRCAGSIGCDSSVRPSSRTPTRSSGSGASVAPARRAAPPVCQPHLPPGEGRSRHQRQRDPAAAPPQRAPRARQRDAPGAGRGLYSVPDVLLLHRRTRVPGHAVHPAWLQTGVHAGARHDSRLPGTRPAARESGLRGAADAAGQGSRLGRHRRPGAGTQASELVFDRVRPHRGRRGDQGLRRRHPVVHRRDSPSRSRATSNAGPSSPTR